MSVVFAAIVYEASALLRVARSAPVCVSVLGLLWVRNKPCTLYRCGRVVRVCCEGEATVLLL